MKIAIFGATGGTGEELLKQSIEKGHTVTAFTRDPSKIILGFKRLKVIKGDARKKRDVESAVKGQDAILSCLGVRPGQKPICEEGTSNIIHAMKKYKVKRIIVESAYGIGKTRNKGVYAIFLSTMIRQLVEDKESMERQIKQSRSDWTIIQPTILTNGPQTKSYKFGEGLLVKGFMKVSRADVAELMLRCAEDRILIKKSVIVT